MGLVALGLLVFYHVRPLFLCTVGHGAVGHGALNRISEPPVESKERLVPLEAHIMSKCPDARVRRLLVQSRVWSATDGRGRTVCAI